MVKVVLRTVIGTDVTKILGFAKDAMLGGGGSSVIILVQINAIGEIHMVVISQLGYALLVVSQVIGAIFVTKTVLNIVSGALNPGMAAISNQEYVKQVALKVIGVILVTGTALKIVHGALYLDMAAISNLVYVKQAATMGGGVRAATNPVQFIVIGETHMAAISILVLVMLAAVVVEPDHNVTSHQLSMTLATICLDVLQRQRILNKVVVTHVGLPLLLALFPTDGASEIQ